MTEAETEIINLKAKSIDKSRTPSGTEIQNTVRGIRAVFSPEYTNSEQTGSVHSTNTNAKIEGQLSHVSQESVKANAIHISDHKRKQIDGDESHEQEIAQAARVLKQSRLT